MTTMSGSQRDCESFFREIEKSLTATRKPTRFLRGLPAPLPRPIPHLFSYPCQQTLYTADDLRHTNQNISANALPAWRGNANARPRRRPAKSCGGGLAGCRCNIDDTAACFVDYCSMPTQGRGEGRQSHAAEGWQGADTTSIRPPCALC